MNVVEQSWAYYPGPKLLQDGCETVEVSAPCGLPEQPIDSSGGEKHQHPKRSFGKIAPGVRCASAHGEGPAGCEVDPFTSIRKVPSTFQNNEMLVFILVNVHGRSVSIVGDDLDHRKSTVRFIGRCTDDIALPRRNL